MQRIYLKDRSFSIDTMPSEISLLVELMDLCNNDDATFEMFSKAIKRDSGLTAKFLKIANSPLYRQWNEISDVKRMLIVLGLKNIKKIIITSAVQQFFSKNFKKSDRPVHLLWLRSLVCAHLAELIARQINYPKTEEAYLAGLLHQVGILLLLSNYKDNYLPVLEQYDATASYRELERSNYGLDHCEVGAALIENWQLDSLMSDAVLFQYAEDKELANSPVLLRILSVARSLSSPLDTEVEEQDITKAKKLLGLPQDSVLECLAVALDESKQVLAELGFSDEADFAEAKDQAKTEVIHKQKAEQLAEQIKNVTLAYCFLNGESDNTESFIKEIRINFDLLFNLKRLLFLHRGKNPDSLVPFNDLQISKLDEISFTSKDENSAIIDCFIHRRGLDSSEHKASISDNQIIRAIGAECAYFLPIGTTTENLGVLVIGLARKELAAFKEKLPLLRLLSTEIGKKYFLITQAEGSEDCISLTTYDKIVHEVRNPLTIINNYLYILGRKLDDDHPAKEEISFIKDEMERVGAILVKARGSELQVDGTSRTDINKLLNELDRFFSNSLYGEKNISSTLQLESGLPVLSYPEHKLKQVFINIIKNAVEALPQSGSLEISSRDNCFQNGNQFVEISLKDNGPGIPAKVLKNLFKPVESTKKGHSGLGLSIVGDLISELSGTITCYSSREAGTEFKILLPRNLADQQVEQRNL